MVAALCEHARYPVPDNVVVQIGELAARYGRVVLTKDGDALVCTCLDRPTAERLARDQATGPYLDDRIDGTHFRGVRHCAACSSRRSSPPGFPWKIWPAT
jgi:hypothetical protein